MYQARTLFVLEDIYGPSIRYRLCVEASDPTSDPYSTSDRSLYIQQKVLGRSGRRFPSYIFPDPEEVPPTPPGQAPSYFQMKELGRSAAEIQPPEKAPVPEPAPVVKPQPRPKTVSPHMRALVDYRRSPEGHRLGGVDPQQFIKSLRHHYPR